MKKVIAILMIAIFSLSCFSAAFAAEDAEAVLFEEVVGGPMALDDLDTNEHAIGGFVATGKLATCTETGYDYYECTMIADGTTHVHAIITPALGHDWGPWTVVTPQNCYSEGLEKRVCNRCKAEETRPIAANEHAWRLNFIENTWPSCTTEGSVTWQYICDTCGAEAKVYTCPILVPEQKNSPVFALDEEVAEEIGMTEDMIKVVTDELNAQWELEVLFDMHEDNVHIFDAWVTTVEPTCVAEGTRIRICKACETKEMEIIEPLGPQFVLTGKKLLNCFELEETYTCAICNGKEDGHEFTEIKAVQAHTFVEDPKYIIETSDNIELIKKNGEVVGWKFLTCEEDGYLVYDCIHNNYDPADPYNCDHPDDPEWYVPHKVIVPGKAHEWGPYTQVIAPDQDGSGNELGYWVRECTYCGKVEELVAASDVCEIVAPTCTEDGKQVHLDGTEDVIPATGHVEVEDAAVEPTCTEAGKTAGSHCEVCGEVIVAQEEIPALGHDFTEEIIPATNTADGKIVKTCTRCGEVETEVIPATGETVIELFLNSPEMMIGDTQQIEATITPVEAATDIKYESDNEAVATIDEDGVITAVAPGSAVITVTVGEAEASAVVCVLYNDNLNPKAYYYDAVNWAAATGVTRDTGANFNATAMTTRAEVVTFLYRNAGEPEVTGEMPFVDVPADAWYYKAVLWAYQNGITTGYKDGKGNLTGSFGPNDSITRDQVITFLYRVNGEPAVEAEATDFVDVVEGKWYEPAVKWAKANSITEGVRKDVFGIGQAALRGHVITFIYRAVK